MSANEIGYIFGTRNAFAKGFFKSEYAAECILKSR